MFLIIRVNELLTQNSNNNLLQNQFKSLIPKNNIQYKTQEQQKNN